MPASKSVPVQQQKEKWWQHRSVGFVVLALGLIERLIGWGGSIDFVLTRSADPGWVGSVLQFMVRQSAWFGVALIIGGVILIVLSERARTDRRIAELLGNRAGQTGPRLPPPASKFTSPTYDPDQPRLELEEEETPVLTTEGFDYPFPKAVLQISIEKPKGTAEARAGGGAHRMSIVAQVKNEHHSAIENWDIYVTAVCKDEEDLNISGKLAVRKAYSKIEPGKSANILLIHRDITDQVSRPPFLLRMAKRDVPLKDNSEYIIELDLVCGNPYPTHAMISLRTGKGLDAEAKVMFQIVSRQPRSGIEAKKQP